MFLFSFIIVILLNNIFYFGCYIDTCIWILYFIVSICYTSGYGGIVTKNNLYYFYNKFVYNIIFLYMLIKHSYVSIKWQNFTWKPIFKKSSYFGLYRSSRNQFLNK